MTPAPGVLKSGLQVKTLSDKPVLDMASSSSFVFLAISLEFTILGEIFAYVMFIIQP